MTSLQSNRNLSGFRVPEELENHFHRLPPDSTDGLCHPSQAFGLAFNHRQPTRRLSTDHQPQARTRLHNTGSSLIRTETNRPPYSPQALSDRQITHLGPLPSLPSGPLSLSHSRFMADLVAHSLSPVEVGGNGHRVPLGLENQKVFDLTV
ncbi:hypothetical protein CROQUDRAFT_86810 [Cronartium quercuum f. sp. fusiforme G11]|uniref:Uncharacterized protein n=1 Tax=Cronartium quercuum f. sp. fusiforme G11 TaxID=708437 RepID=A0A9P6NQA0_9BASI|nr:hypothetical protein CROQUDRAFT_86810 [Cronartium quercuum f. sp. fusiforme G11]